MQDEALEQALLTRRIHEVKRRELGDRLGWGVVLSLALVSFLRLVYLVNEDYLLGQVSGVGNALIQKNEELIGREMRDRLCH